MSRKLYTLLSLMLVLAFALGACTPKATDVPAADPTAEAPAAEKVTVTWWHISTVDPGLTDWQEDGQ